MAVSGRGPRGARRPRRLRRLLGLGAIVGIFALLTRGGRERASSTLRHADRHVEGFSGSGARWYGLLARPLLSPLYHGVAREVAHEVRVRGRQEGACIADIGCGPGDLASLIAAELPGAEVVGLDVSEEMIELARSRHAGSGDGLRFIYGDVAALPFDAGSLDLVVSTLSLHHWADPARGLNEISRVLRPGAVALLYDLRPLTTRSGVAAIVADAGLEPGDIRVESMGHWPPANLIVRVRIEPAAPLATAAS